jgi:hypothetical protein
VQEKGLEEIGKTEESKKYRKGNEGVFGSQEQKT